MSIVPGTDEQRGQRALQDLGSMTTGVIAHSVSPDKRETVT